MPNVPACFPSSSEPCAWAASSTSHTPLRARRSAMAGISAVTKPPICTTTAAAVLRVRRRSTSAADVDRVRGSVSISTGFAPAARAAAAVAKNVFAGSRTSRPATPRPRRMISSAAVPLLIAIACLAPTNSANRASKASPYGPNVKRPVVRTSLMRSAIHSRSSSEKSMRTGGTGASVMEDFTLMDMSSAHEQARDLGEPRHDLRPQKPVVEVAHAAIVLGETDVHEFPRTDVHAHRILAVVGEVLLVALGETEARKAVLSQQSQPLHREPGSRHQTLVSLHVGRPVHEEDDVARLFLDHRFEGVDQLGRKVSRAARDLEEAERKE